MVTMHLDVLHFNFSTFTREYTVLYFQLKTRSNLFNEVLVFTQNPFYSEKSTLKLKWGLEFLKMANQYILKSSIIRLNWISTHRKWITVFSGLTLFTKTESPERRQSDQPTIWGISVLWKFTDTSDLPLSGIIVKQYIV